MFCDLVYYEPKPGKIHELVNHFTWEAEISRNKEPETLRFEIYKSRSKVGIPEDALYVYRAFTDKEAWDAHLKNNEAIKHWKSAGLQEKLATMREIQFLGEPIFLFSRTEKPGLDVGE